VGFLFNEVKIVTFFNGRKVYSHLTIHKFKPMIHQVYFYIVLRLLAILKLRKEDYVSERTLGYAFKEKDKKYIVGKYIEKQ